MTLLPMSGRAVADLLQCRSSLLFTFLSVHLCARYKLCQLLPRLRSSLRLPADKQLLQQLNFCVQKLLCREKDKDVVASIRKVAA